MSASLPQFIPEANAYYFRDPSILWSEDQVTAELRRIGWRDGDIPLLLELSHICDRYGIRD